MSGHQSIMRGEQERPRSDDGPTEIELHHEVEANLARAKNLIEQLQSADREYIIDTGKESRLQHLIAAAHQVLERIADDNLHTTYLYQASFKEYFAILSQTEQLLNGADQQAEDEDLGEIEVAEISTDDTTTAQLSVINSEQRIELPVWALDYVAGFINEKAIQQLGMNAERLDELYLEAVAERVGYARRLAFAGLTDAMLIQAALEKKGADQKQAIQQIRESFKILRDDWIARFEPLAEKYQLIIDKLPSITQLIAAYAREHIKTAE